MTQETSSKRSTRVLLSGLTPYSGTFGRNEIIHLLKRTMFGATRADIAAFESMTLTQAIDALLSPSAASLTPAPPINNYNSTRGIDPDVEAGADWTIATEASSSGTVNFNGSRRESLKAWHIGLAINQERTILEKMMLFWHNHFATEVTSTSSLRGYIYLKTIRQYALGNFKDFTRAITFDPAMLQYLNGNLNSKQSPDENYARELQELFTLGKGTGSGYTEDDVKAAAKVLTGWRTREVVTQATAPRRGRWESYFDATRHDTTNKQFSAFFNNTIINGSPTANTEANARREIDELLNMIFAQEEVSKFICRKLYTFFIYYKIDAQIEADVITPLAAIFRQSNYDIMPVLRALLLSEHFFDTANQGCYIKSPMDYTIGLSRELGLGFAPATDYAAQYASWRALNATNGGSSQGQDILDPPSVSGWPAYYQTPNFHEMWVNTDTYMRRIKFADQLMTTNGLTVATTWRLKLDFIAFIQSFGTDAQDPNLVIDKALEVLYRVPLSVGVRNTLKAATLLQGQNGDQYWTDAWINYVNAPTNTTFKNIVLTRLNALFTNILHRPELHLC